MSDPVITNYGGVFIYYTCDRDPTSNEPLIYSDYSDLLIMWWNTTTNNLFWCVDDTSGSMVWINSALATNIISLINTAGWNLNISRNYSQRSSPAFSTPYTPSATNDTFVLATVNIVLSVLQSSTIIAQVDTGSGFITVATASSGSVAINNTSTLSFIVPANASYQIVSSGTGTNTLNNIMELSL